jgi:hypothetical protein
MQNIQGKPGLHRNTLSQKEKKKVNIFLEQVHTYKQTTKTVGFHTYADPFLVLLHLILVHLSQLINQH